MTTLHQAYRELRRTIALGNALTGGKASRLRHLGFTLQAAILTLPFYLVLLIVDKAERQDREL